MPLNLVVVQPLDQRQFCCDLFWGGLAGRLGFVTLFGLGVSHVCGLLVLGGNKLAYRRLATLSAFV